MKKQHTILEVLFPQVRAEILRLLFTPPQKERYVRELARMSGLTLSTVQEELRRLSALKLVKSWSNRFHRFYRADRDHPLFADLVHMVDTSEKMPQLEHSAVHRQLIASPSLSMKRDRVKERDARLQTRGAFERWSIYRH